MIQFGYSWGNVFGLYLFIAVISCFGMKFVHKYNDNDDDSMEGNSTMNQINVAWRLLTTVSIRLQQNLHI